VRENKAANPNMEVYELFNISTTETFTRSINTSITTGICTLVILVSAILFHIESIRVFALPMFFGLISGAYSSICLANVAWAMWEKRKHEKIE
jgi:SecD/SecF fusion protein